MHSFRTLVNVITPDTYTVRGVTLTARLKIAVPQQYHAFDENHTRSDQIFGKIVKSMGLGTRRDQNFVQIAKTNARLDPIC